MVVRKQDDVHRNSGTTTPIGAVVVLIVEDSVTQAMKLQHLLERNGYEVFSARDGVEALAKLEARRPTLIISDINMPEMNGYEVCERLKACGIHLPGDMFEGVTEIR